MNYDLKQPPGAAPQLSHARRSAQAGGPGPRMQARLALALFLAAAAGFLLVAMQVMHHGPITAIDLQVAQWLHRNAGASLTDAMLGVSQMHAPAGIAVLAAGLAVYMALKRDHYWLLAVLMTVPAGMALNVLLKHAFERPRPVFDHPLVTLVTFSFPSGHAAYSTMLYGLLAAYVAHRVDRWHWRLASVLICGAIVLVVCVSRLYLGAHYLSDILAGMLEGIAWLALVWIAVTGMRRRQRPGAGY